MKNQKSKKDLPKGMAIISIDQLKAIKGGNRAILIIDEDDDGN